jgi:hypothetical protein
MFAVSVNCALAPEAKLPTEQFTLPLLPTPGSVQTKAGPVFCRIETNVVPAGSGSPNVAGDEMSGPLFEAVIVQAIVFPAVAVAGPVFVTARSLVITVRKVRLLLLSGFGSVVVVETLAVFVNGVFDAVPGGMWPVSVKVALAPAARLAIVQVTVPPEPTLGWLLQSNAGPLFCAIETNVIVPGSASVSEKLLAASGPELFTLIVYATSLSGAALAGPSFWTPMSAWGMGTVTEDELELFSPLGSNVPDDTVAMFVKVVPSGVAGGMWAAKVKFALDPAGKSARVQVIVPFVPTEGAVQLNAGPLF